MTEKIPEGLTLNKCSCGTDREPCAFSQHWAVVGGDWAAAWWVRCWRCGRETGCYTTWPLAAEAWNKGEVTR